MVSEFLARFAVNRLQDVLAMAGELLGSPAGILLLVVVPLAYFLPAIIGFWRRHNNRAAILLLTLFLGWTGLGWIIALIWSSTDNTARRCELVGPPRPPYGTAVPVESPRPEESEDEDAALPARSWRDVLGELSTENVRVMVILGVLGAVGLILGSTTVYFWRQAAHLRGTLAQVRTEAKQEKQKYMAMRENRIHRHVPGLEKFGPDDYIIDVASPCLAFVAFNPDRGLAVIKWINETGKSLQPSVTVDLYNEWGGNIGRVRSGWTFRSLDPGDAEVEIKEFSTAQPYLYYRLDYACG